MAILLGIDTGGTYTDAVLLDEAGPPPGIRAKAKALTTHADLSYGIGAAIDAVLSAADLAPDRIGLVSVSTTLATNALVEGRGGRVCLILIGFDEGALDRAGLGAALGSDPVVFIDGGHTPTGQRQAPLDVAAARAAVAIHSDCAAFAVIAHFGTRHPEDECAVREIAAASGRPVTCGHELAESLGGPKRALTCLLNARLIHLIAGLIGAVQGVLADRGISAPLMLVRGDGSLVSAEFARARPIETILSGPAASLVGAAHLTAADEAVVSDIGGTTTDIAILSGGRPTLSPDGARVGEHHTMVRAVEMTTHGLGGDSSVDVDETALEPRLHLGPGRLIPVSLLARDHPAEVHTALDRALEQPLPGRFDGRFLVRGAGRMSGGLTDAEERLHERLGDWPLPAVQVLSSRKEIAALKRLSARGLVRMAGFTPSDAAHVTGDHRAWDRHAAQKAADLMARHRTGAGRPAAPDGAAFAATVLEALVSRSATLLMDAALVHDGVGEGLASSRLARAALDGHAGAARIDIGLALPLIGLGASAPVYYPGIARRLGTEALIPPDADVANAVGAVAGRVRIVRRAVVSQPAEGLFRVHLAEAPGDFSDLPSARAHAFRALGEAARANAQNAGAAEIGLSENWEEQSATVEGRPVFVEAIAEVVASGRPQIA